MLIFSRLRIGYLETAFDAEYPGREHDQATLETLRELGAPLVTDRPCPISRLVRSFRCECGKPAAALTKLTRSGEDAQLVTPGTQTPGPTYSARSDLCRPVEYLQASRARTLLQQEMAQANPGRRPCISLLRCRRETFP